MLLRKTVHNNIVGVVELSPTCQSTVMVTIDSCANVPAPRIAVRVYKTHSPLCGNDRMQWVKTTKLSQTAVCTDNYQIYLLTMIGQNRSMKNIVWRQGHPLLLDRMDNYDNTLHTYTDRMLSITSPVTIQTNDRKFLWGTCSRDSQSIQCEVPDIELGHREVMFNKWNSGKNRLNNEDILH